MKFGGKFEILYDTIMSPLHQRNGWMLISSAAHGMGRSNLLSTLGCKTPRRPMDCPLTITSAQRPGKYVGSVEEIKEDGNVLF